jgi:hypothetical protein
MCFDHPHVKHSRFVVLAFVDDASTTRTSRIHGDMGLALRRVFVMQSSAWSSVHRGIVHTSCFSDFRA